MRQEVLPRSGTREYMRKNLFQSITGQIIVVVLAIVLFQFAASCYLYYSIYRSECREALQNNEILLRQANESYISDIINDVKTISLEMFYNSVFWSKDASTELSREAIYPVLANSLSRSHKLDSIYLYSSASSYLYIMDQNSFNDIPIRNRGNNLFSELSDNLEEYAWFSEALETSGQITVTKNRDIRYGKENLISFSRYMKYPLSGGSPNYLVSFNVKESTFKNIIDQICENDEIGLLYDNEGQFILGNQQSAIPGDSDISIPEKYDEDFFSGKDLDKKHITIKNQSADTEWTIIKIIPKKLIFADIFQRFIINCLSVLAIYLIGIIILYLLLIRITKPLKELSYSISSYRGDEISLDKSLARREDEVGILYRSFDDMARRINHLINSEYESQIQEKQAKLESLQMQLNPHFLYNTLQTISGIAIEKDIYEIENMCSSLSHILRYSLNSDKKLVMISEELENVNNYFEILKYRFNDRISIRISLPENVLSCLVPVFALQLPVENAVKHGLEEKFGQELIEIFEEKSDPDKVVINVSDNGRGISRQQMDELNRKFESDESLREDLGYEHKGLRNLNLRLKYYFGNEYGIRIGTNDKGGMTVRIMIPGKAGE